jgi:hypothetical protein
MRRPEINVNVSTHRPTVRREVDGRTREQRVGTRSTADVHGAFLGEPRARARLSRGNRRYLRRAVGALTAAGVPPVEAELLAVREYQTEGEVNVERILRDGS